MPTVNSFGSRTSVQAGGRSVQIYSLPALEAGGMPEIARLPYSVKILLENLLLEVDGIAREPALAHHDAAQGVKRVQDADGGGRARSQPRTRWQVAFVMDYVSALRRDFVANDGCNADSQNREPIQGCVAELLREGSIGERSQTEAARKL